MNCNIGDSEELYNNQNVLVRGTSSLAPHSWLILLVFVTTQVHSTPYLSCIHTLTKRMTSLL